MVAGVLNDQCVDSTIRDACDLGYLVTAVTDACATLSRERHESSLRNNAGCARQMTTNALIAEITALPRRAGARTVTSQGATSEALIFVGTCDLAGLVRGKAFPAADLAARKHSGVGLTGSSIMLSAFGPIYATPFGTFGDLKLVPDLATRARITAADGSALELVLGDVQNLDDSPWSCCPRTFLRRALEKLERSST